MENRNNKDQYGQCDIVKKYYSQNKCDKTFVEVGCWDGFEISNTFYLEKELNWDGIVVEPIFEKYNQARLNRWCKVVNACIDDKPGNQKFYHIIGYSEMLSGLYEDFHPYFKNRVDHEMKMFSQNFQIYDIECKTLNSLLNDNKIENVDYLSLDTCSTELKILQSFDSSKCKMIGLNTNNINQEEIFEWFRRNRYSQLWKHETSDEYIFVK